MDAARDQQRVIVITGASSGIGRQCAIRFSHDPRAYLILIARRENELRKTLMMCGGDSRGRVVALDLMDTGSIDDFATDLHQREGRCDVLINNAGSSSDIPLESEGALAEITRTIALNVTAQIALTLALLPLLKTGMKPAIINVASVAGTVGIPPSPAYAATKFAIRGWSESLHGRLAPDGIFVASLQPGPVPTPGWPQEHVTSLPLGHLIVTPADRVAKIVERMATRQKAPTRTTRRYWRILTVFAAVMPRSYHRLLRRIGRSTRNSALGDRKR